MDFSPYIAELLYTYDCVIIPEFGGFVANYKPARIHPVSNKIFPPSKQISFNKNLKQNDGLLANKIAQEQQIPYAKAVELIEKWRKEIEKQLKTKGYFTFANIGTLKRMADATLHFDAKAEENFFQGAYGLTPVIAKPITNPKTLSIPQKTSNYKWIQRAAAIFVGGMITSYLLLNYDVVVHQSGQLATFFRTEKALYTPNHKKFEFTSVNKKAVIDTNGQTAFLKIEGTQPVIIGNIAQKADSTSVSVHSPQLRFHIIAGCFSKESNAEKLAQELKEQGFEPQIITSYKNYYTVIVKSFATKAQAKSFLPQTKSLIAHSWVLEWNV